MSVLSIARIEGEPRAVFSALEHHWRDHPPQAGLLERTVAHGPGGFVVIETWRDEATARGAWALIRLEGVPSPDIDVYGVVARAGGGDRASLGSWLELALPDAEAWNERVVPRDS